MNTVAFLDLGVPDLILTLVSLAVFTLLVLAGRAAYKGFVKGYFGNKKQ